MNEQAILDELRNQRDIFINSGNFTKKSIVTKDGDTIFFRSLEDIEKMIDLYRTKLNQANGGAGRLLRVKCYG